MSTLEAAIADATENLGESETREALLKKAEFFAQVLENPALSFDWTNFFSDW